MLHKFKFYLLCLSCFVLFLVIDQKAQAQSSICCGFTYGPSIQVYPAGMIVGVDGYAYIGGTWQLYWRGAANIIDRKDYGEHDEEKGTGYGGTLGFETGFLVSGLHFGVHADVWYTEIDWKGTGNKSPANTSGVTKFVILQPTAILRYNIALTNTISLNPSAAFGWEINQNVKGEPVGEGAILLGGISIQFGM